MNTIQPFSPPEQLQWLPINSISPIDIILKKIQKKKGYRRFGPTLAMLQTTGDSVKENERKRRTNPVIMTVKLDCITTVVIPLR